MMTLTNLSTLLAIIDDGVDSNIKVRIKIDNIEYDVSAVRFVDAKTNESIFLVTLIESTFEYLKGVIDSFDSLTMVNRFMHVLPAHVPESDEIVIKIMPSFGDMPMIDIDNIAVITEYNGVSTDDFIVINN